MDWLKRLLGLGAPADRLRPPAPANLFGTMMWLAENLPAEGFVVRPPAMTHPQPRRAFRFAPTARPAHARWLVEAVAPGQMLGFFDPDYPSISDPGGFVTAVRAHEASRPWRVRVANHGWHTEWTALDAGILAAYLWACRESPGATDFYGLATGPAPPGTVDGAVTDDPASPLRREIARRVRDIGEIPRPDPGS